MKASEPKKPSKVIVAVHGIGDQIHYSTAQQVLAQFCRYHGEVAAVPLGNFHTPEGTLVLETGYPPELSDLAFAEVYWAPVPREVVNERFKLEAIKPWIKTVVGRVSRNSLATREITPADQRMIEEVLGEMSQTIGVLDRLCSLAAKMGLFSFDLNRVLVDFVDDVQIVTEFKDRCRQILKIFDDQMASVHKLYPQADIYFVTHSEGTVVALLGLLHALCREEDAPWVRKVRGLMTLGSPIDKHLILWPELFKALEKPCRFPDQPIEWHNYYDYGDPVGFELDTARGRFTPAPWDRVFNFGKDHDHGFARYTLPGKAHNDYWKDPDVFGHFIRHVIYQNQVPPKPRSESFERPPASKSLARILSWVAPYVAALALLFCGVFVLYKAVHGYVDAGQETSAPAVRSQGVLPEDELQESLKVFGTVLSLTLLLAGLTVVARIPRLTRVVKWRFFGFLVFSLSVILSRISPCIPFLRGPDTRELRQCVDAGFTVYGALDLIVLSIGVLLAAYFFSKLYPTWGMRALLIPGGIATAYYLYKFVQESGKSPEGDLWPVLLAGAFFLYIWWLVALLFDLIFVWHRYVRCSGTVPYLQAAQAYGKASTRPPSTVAL